MEFPEDKIKIFQLSFERTKIFVTVVVFLLFVTMIKLVYFWSYKISQYLPESCLLLFIGIVFGICLKLFNFQSVSFGIDSVRFMYVLLPPIVLESAFEMYHEVFMANIIGVLIFAIIATILNFILLSLFMYFLMMMELFQGSVNLMTILLFNSLITSIDPVAVLAIFQDIHVDDNLYYLVFGESLLNDGVCMVLYNVLQQMSDFEEWTTMLYFKSFAAFVAVAVGGGVVGTVVSLVTCRMTRVTHRYPLSEPIIVCGMSMVAYLLADGLQWSVVISMIMYGLIQVAYNFHNITHKSLIVIKRMMKILSNLSESIIFLSLGVTVSKIDSLQWIDKFSLWSLFSCIYVRFLVTFILSAFINVFRLTMHKIEYKEQFLISYGGIRGGIAYCLSILLMKSDRFDEKAIQDATIFIVIFTTVVMGITIKPLVSMMSIRRSPVAQISLFDEINSTILQHTYANIEAIIDSKGRNSFYEFMNQVNSMFVRPLLQRDPLNCAARLMDIYRGIDFRLYMAYASRYGTPLSDHYLNKLKPNLRKAKYQFFDSTYFHKVQSLVALSVDDPILRKKTWTTIKQKLRQPNDFNLKTAAYSSFKPNIFIHDDSERTETDISLKKVTFEQEFGEIQELHDFKERLIQQTIEVIDHFSDKELHSSSI